MKTKTVKGLVIGFMVGTGAVVVSAYQAQIWSPVQFVEKIFFTVNGEQELNKATVVIDGVKGIIESKGVKVNGKEVATEEYVDNAVKNVKIALPKCNEGYVLTSIDGKNFKCVKSGPVTKTIVDYNGGRRWSDGTYAESCLGYIKPSKVEYKYTGRVGNGVYWIKPKGLTNPIKVYCDMTTDGGGWTLVMSINGNNRTFIYDSPYWTTTRILKSSSLFPGKSEYKSEAFNVLPLKEIKIVYDNQSGYKRSIKGYLSSKSLLNVFKYTSANTPIKGISRADYLHLYGAWHQANCNRNGINVHGGRWGRMRLGLIMNQENDCNTPDAFVGIGMQDCRGFSSNRIISAGANAGRIDWRRIGFHVFTPMVYVYIK